MNTKIKIARTEQEISDCYPIMSELRPHIKSQKFVPQVKKMARIAGFKLVYLIDGEIKAVAGFRISEWLARGRYLEIEDLVTSSGDRSKGYGGQVFDWLVNYARARDCHQVRLVSHVKRFDAHRFYLAKKMITEAHYFSLPLD